MKTQTLGFFNNIKNKITISYFERHNWFPNIMRIIICFDFGIEEVLSYPCHMCVIQSACVFLVSLPTHLFSKILRRRMSGHQTGKHLFFLTIRAAQSIGGRRKRISETHLVFKKETLVPKQEYTCNRQWKPQHRPECSRVTHRSKKLLVQSLINPTPP